MYNVARLNDKDRDAIFKAYAFQFGNNKAIIEKGFLGDIGLGLFVSQMRIEEFFRL